MFDAHLRCCCSYFLPLDVSKAVPHIFKAAFAAQRRLCKSLELLHCGFAEFSVNNFVTLGTMVTRGRCLNNKNVSHHGGKCQN